MPKRQNKALRATLRGLFEKMPKDDSMVPIGNVGLAKHLNVHPSASLKRLNRLMGKGLIRLDPDGEPQIKVFLKRVKTWLDEDDEKALKDAA